VFSLARSVLIGRAFCGSRGRYRIHQRVARSARHARLPL